MLNEIIKGIPKLQILSYIIVSSMASLGVFTRFTKIDEEKKIMGVINKAKYLK